MNIHILIYLFFYNQDLFFDLSIDKSEDDTIFIGKRFKQKLVSLMLNI